MIWSKNGEQHAMDTTPTASTSAVKSGPISVPIASATVAPMSSWAKLEFNDKHNRNVWLVDTSAIPREIFPIFEGYLKLSLNHRLFAAKCQARDPSKNKFSLIERIYSDMASHAFIPHVMKTPGLLVMLTSHDQGMADQLLPEYMAASEVYKAYRSYLELFSFFRGALEPKKPGVDRFDAVHASVLERGYATMTNLRSSVSEMLSSCSETSSADAAGEEMVGRFANVSYAAAIAEIYSLECAILVILGINPSNAALGSILATECLTPPAISCLSSADIDACTRECNQLANVLGMSLEEAVFKSEEVSKNYAAPAWFILAQLKSLIAAIRGNPAQ